MRVPIAYALHHPDRVDVPVRALDLAAARRADVRGARPRRVPVPAPGARGRAGRRRPPRACSTPPTRSRCTPSWRTGSASSGIPAVIEATLEQLPAARVHCLRHALRRRRRGPRGRRSAAETGRGARLSWLPRLPRLRRADHPARGRALRRRQGGRDARRALLALLPAAASGACAAARPSTRIGSIPLGGYVKITGMNPAEEIPPDVAHRAYYRQPVWKRIVVIAAGPAVNIVMAFLHPAGDLPRLGRVRRLVQPIAAVDAKRGAGAGVLKPGDRVIAVDGKRGDIASARSDRHAPLRAAARSTAARRADARARARSRATAATARTHSITPVYEADVKRPLLGFGSARDARDVGVGEAAELQHRGDVGVHQGDRRERSRDLRRREARARSPASSAPTR